MIRGLAATAVVYWHAGGYENEYISALNVPGRTAVWLFFGISGYVIAYGFVSRKYLLNIRDLRYFYLNRFLRIYPLFLSLTLISWLTVSVVKGYNPISVKDILPQFLAVQFDQAYLLNGVFWTLGIEIHFYLMAPLLVLPLLLDKKVAVIYSALAIYLTNLYAYSYAVDNLGWSYDGRNIISNLPHFIVGMTACRLVNDLDREITKTLLYSVVASALALLLVTNWLYHELSGIYWSLWGIVLVDVLIALLVVIHHFLGEHDVSGNLWVRLLSYLGVLSYGIYALHGYLINYFLLLQYHATLLLILSTLLALIFYRLIERPALSFKKYG